MSTGKKILYCAALIVWTFASLLASQFFVSFVMAMLLGEKFTEPFWTLIYYIFSYTLALLFIVMWTPLTDLWQKRGTKKEKRAHFSLKAWWKAHYTLLGLDHLPTIVDVGLAPIGYIAYVFVANFVVNLLAKAPWFNANEEQDIGFNLFISGWDRFFAMFAVIIVAPIAEELIMRGWLYGSLREKLKAPVAILLVSVLFGILHGQLNVGITVGIMSIILCGLREITGTIWGGIFLHVISNGIAFYMLYSLGI